MKSILTFEKWTKINVQNGQVKNTLTDEFFYLDKEKLWFQFARNIKKTESIFFIFFQEKYLEVFSCHI
jgi:hypothetical protein